ncbi:hypothetical protein SAMN05216582_12064 [Selenomonas ruminantium]|uniref:Uncharacterized protein n=2 Tax=Selenomonas ruminantium TaxID=971 RepID=A0A1M6VT94_SELRU|nr:hypothetical protein SAMN05216582_12064 [Selenomonas ruminantium]
MLKKADIVLIILLIILSLLPLLAFERPAAPIYAEIRQDGKVLEKVTLTGHTGNREIPVTFTANGSDGHNLIRIENEKISIIEADCPDKVCVQTGPICKAGEIIACLPHKLIIEIKEY